MEVGVGVISKELCLSSPQKERELSVIISWSPKGFVLFSPEYFKLLTKVKTWVLFVISEFCYIKNIGTNTWNG